MLCELNSTIAEELNVPLDGAVSLVRGKVVFAILVVDRIDWDEFRAVIDRSVAGPDVVVLDALFRGDPELVILGVPVSIVVFEDALELEELTVMIGKDAGFVEFEKTGNAWCCTGNVRASGWVPTR